MINRELPVFLDYGSWHEKDDENNDMDVEIKIEFKDMSGGTHNYTAQIESKRCVSPMIVHDPIKTALKEIKDSIDRIAAAKNA